MITVRRLSPQGLQEGGAELLEGQGPVWVDVEAPDAATLDGLKARFDLHRLAIEDCLHLDQRPKLEAYPGHQFLVLQGFPCPNEAAATLELFELHFFIGPDWLITVHERAGTAISRAAGRVASDPQGTLGRGVDFVAYLLSDALVDDHFPLLDKFSDEIDALEAQVFEKVDPSVMQKAFELKRSLVQLRRVLAPQRDVVGLLARSGVPQVQERTQLYFRDVYDHLVRLAEGIDAARDLVGNSIDAWLSLVANRTNDITKQLTILASIFLPMSFVVGFFGQNFDVLTKGPALWVMVSLLAALPLGMLLWFRRKGWL